MGVGARAERNPTGPHLGWPLDEDEVLMRQSRVGDATGEHHSSTNAGLGRRRLTEQALGDVEQLLIVCHGVKRLSR